MQDQQVVDAARNMMATLKSLRPELDALKKEFERVMSESPDDPKKVLEVYAKMYQTAIVYTEKFSEGLTLPQVEILGNIVEGKISSGDSELDKAVQENLEYIRETEGLEYSALMSKALRVIIDNDLVGGIMKEPV